MAFMYGLTDDALADNARILPHKVLGTLARATVWAPKVLYVDGTVSGASDTGLAGTKRTSPFKTLAYALGKATAKCVILVAPAHTENIAANTTALAVADVLVLGCGNGNRKPLITFSGGTGNTITISGAGCTFDNLAFTTSFDSLVACLTITGADTTIANCSFVEGSAQQILNSISIGTAASRAHVVDCEFLHSGVGPETAILIAGTGPAAGADRVRIERNWIHGNFSNAPIYSNAVHTRCVIINNYIVQINTSATNVPIRFAQTTATGLIANNRCGFAVARADRTTTPYGLLPGGCYPCENYVSDSEAPLSGLLTPGPNTN